MGPCSTKAATRGKSILWPAAVDGEKLWLEKQQNGSQGTRVDGRPWGFWHSPSRVSTAGSRRGRATTRSTQRRSSKEASSVPAGLQREAAWPPATLGQWRPHCGKGGCGGGGGEVVIIHTYIPMLSNEIQESDWWKSKFKFLLLKKPSWRLFGEKWKQGQRGHEWLLQTLPS